MYGKVQEKKRKGLNKSQASRDLGVDYKTILKYWDMTPDEYAATKAAASSRVKKAERYESFVLECLNEYPDMSAAQIYDWIKERYKVETLSFQERAFRNYVKCIREEYDIPKVAPQRQYEAVDELPPGFQGQVDMGEIILKTASGRHKKIYCFAMVLSHSRYKFAYWTDRPFTTESFVDAHIKAFTYFGGRPKELVYDQDKILAVSENAGDIIYTEGFQNYLNVIKFEIFLCHGADPESKGKVENVVKYLKHGFAKHRTFTDIDSFNADCMAWLRRTGNAKVHETTKKIPVEVFKVEREYLIPVSEYSFAPAVNENIPHQVRKDNTVLYRGNRYRVPKGTYKPGLKVYLIITDDEISIIDIETGEIYAKHTLCQEKGRLIGTKREGRDKSRTIVEQEMIIRQHLSDDELIVPFLNQVHKNRSRYYRDQLGVIRNLIKNWDNELIIECIHYCTEREMFSAGELKSAVIYFDTLRNEKVIRKFNNALPSKYLGNKPQVRDLKVYEDAMEGSVING